MNVSREIICKCCRKNETVYPAGGGQIRVSQGKVSHLDVISIWLDGLKLPFSHILSKIAGQARISSALQSITTSNCAPCPAKALLAVEMYHYFSKQVQDSEFSS